ncbi:MAG: glycosyltransferase [Lentisphaeria bacterium]|nr:glycosyltransferase [Lentisphaeria bacterium]NQZ68660.1 glycosyltransferase [Lentisphaeria bacterium]
MKILYICPPVAGHLNPFTSLACELIKRGHDLHHLGIPDSKERVENFNITFHDSEAAKYGRGSLKIFTDKLGESRGLRAIKLTTDIFFEVNLLYINGLIPKLEMIQPDIVIIDHTYPAAQVICDCLNVPAITLAATPLLTLDPHVPPLIFGFKFSTSAFFRIRNRCLNSIMNMGYIPLLYQINKARKQHGLAKLKRLDDAQSQLATLVQQPESFEYPRKFPIKNVHYIGPIHSHDSRPKIPFPYDKLDADKTLIYASMGTLQNRIESVFHEIAKSVLDLKNVQLIISLGGGGIDLKNKLPGDAIIVDNAPQLDLIKRASIVITHCGMNTTMETLTMGKPMICLPVTNDQPSIASRVEWIGAGIAIRKKPKATKIKDAIEKILADDSYRRCAKKVQEEIAELNSLESASEIIESLMKEI